MEEGVGDYGKDFSEIFGTDPIISAAPDPRRIELDRAEAMLHHLLDAPSLSAPEQDYLEILGNLIEEYESKAHPMEPLPPHQMLAMSIESKNVTQTEVSRATGIPVSTISELIAQKREFNRAHIEKLCAYFGLDPKAFIHVAKTELVAR